MKKLLIISVFAFFSITVNSQHRRVLANVTLEGRQINEGGAVIDSLFILNQDNIDNYDIDTRDWSQYDSIVALSNTVEIQRVIDSVSSATNLKGLWLSNLDIYFEVRSQRESGSYNTSGAVTHSNAIKIPSNFHFKMDNDVHLRVYPNDTPKYYLISTYDGDNILITGGNLWGDRDDHTYITGTNGYDTHEWGHIISIAGIHNITVNGVNTRNGTGDGFHISGLYPRNGDGSLQAGNKETLDALVKNCIIDNNRRNNMSPVDGDRIIIENNIISNAGQTSNGISGTLPMSGIDLEPFFGVNETSVLEYQLLRNVTIRNNTFVGSFNGDIIFFRCHDVEVYGNTFTRSLSNNTAYDIQIHDNTFTSVTNAPYAFSLSSRISALTGLEQNYNYEIYNNTITGYENGIAIGGKNMTVYNNTITNCKTGIQMTDLDTATFYDNTITSNVANSNGYKNFALGSDATDVTITDDSCVVVGWGILLQSLNGINTGLVITTTLFDANKDIDVRSSNDVTFNTCTYSTYFNDGNNTNVTFIDP